MKLTRELRRERVFDFLVLEDRTIPLLVEPADADTSRAVLRFGFVFFFAEILVFLAGVVFLADAFFAGDFFGAIFFFATFLAELVFFLVTDFFAMINDYKRLSSINACFDCGETLPHLFVASKAGTHFQLRGQRSPEA